MSNKNDLKDIMKITMDINRLRWAYEEMLIDNCYYRHIIDKAIEYLKSRKDDNSMCSVCSVMTEELLNILKGSDSNE